MRQKNDSGAAREFVNETDSMSGKGRRSYTAPQVLSAEGLEAMAAVCNPPSFGKIPEDLCGSPQKPYGS